MSSGYGYGYGFGFGFGYGFGRAGEEHVGRGRVGGVGLRERLGLVGLVALERRRVEWLRALRWRRRVEAVLEGSGLTFRQWLVIVALAEVRRKTGDSVSQNEVATYLEFCRAMRCPR